MTGSTPVLNHSDPCLSWWDTGSGYCRNNIGWRKQESSFNIFFHRFWYKKKKKKMSNRVLAHFFPFFCFLERTQNSSVDISKPTVNSDVYINLAKSLVEGFNLRKWYLWGPSRHSDGRRNMVPSMAVDAALTMNIYSDKYWLMKIISRKSIYFWDFL